MTMVRRFVEQLPDAPPPSIYFGGCAFGSAFYVGIVCGMVERWGPDFYKSCLISGGSAGTLFAVAVALGKTPEEMDSVYRTVAEKTLRYHPIYFASVFLEEGLRKLVSDPLAYKRLEGRCCFGTTEFFSKHRWHVSWESNEDLIQSAVASFNIPIYCKPAMPVKGTHVVDGAYGFAGINLPHGDDTLYVGIDPLADITRTLTNHQMFFPLQGEEYHDMVRSGYLAFKQWDGKLIKKVGRREPNYQALYVLWALKMLELLIYPIFHAVATIFTFLISILPLSSERDSP